MEFNSTLELIETDSKSKAYFDALPAPVQKALLDNYTGATSLDELRAFGDDLITSLY